MRFNELQALLGAYGWTLRRVAGSHYIFGRADRTLSIPFRRPHILSVYVRRVLQFTEGEDDGHPD